MQVELRASRAVGASSWMPRLMMSGVVPSTSGVTSVQTPAACRAATSASVSASASSATPCRAPTSVAPNPAGPVRPAEGQGDRARRGDGRAVDELRDIEAAEAGAVHGADE